MGTQHIDPNHVHHFWGLSPALDLKYVTSAARTLNSAIRGDELASNMESSSVSMLQVCPADTRHTVATMARWWRRAPGCRGSIMVYEPSPEGLARHMLLLSILLDTQLTPRDRTDIYLEVFGNIKLREKTAEYIGDQGRLLASVVLDSNMGEMKGPLNKLFNFSQLKYKEKDELVEVLRSYGDKSEINMGAAWEWRCRQFYGERYDHIRNIVDWDYHMRLVAVQPDSTIVSIQEWREWRAEGHAFDIRDATFTHPNKTLLSTAQGRAKEFTDRNGVQRGRSVTTKGLYLDIQCSPYFAHGVESEEKFLFIKSNKLHIKSASDISAHNLNCYIHELDNRCRLTYEARDPGEADRLEVYRTEHPPPVYDDPPRDVDLDSLEEEESSLAMKTCEQFQISFVTGDFEKNLINKNCNKEIFDVVTVGCLATHRVTSGLEKCAKADAILAMEDSRFMLSLTKEQNEQFHSKMDELAKDNGWQPLGTCENVFEGHHLFSKKQTPPPES